MRRLGILLSGRGSNFEAIADNVRHGRLAAEIAIVISNRPEARGITGHALPIDGVAISLRQIVAKNSTETGISVPLTALQNCVARRRKSR